MMKCVQCGDKATKGSMQKPYCKKCFDKEFDSIKEYRDSLYTYKIGNFFKYNVVAMITFFIAYTTSIILIDFMKFKASFILVVVAVFVYILRYILLLKFKFGVK